MARRVEVELKQEDICKTDNEPLMIITLLSRKSLMMSKSPSYGI